jgi:hypothetical protein
MAGPRGRRCAGGARRAAGGAIRPPAAVTRVRAGGGAPLPTPSSTLSGRRTARQGRRGWGHRPAWSPRPSARRRPARAEAAAGTFPEIRRAQPEAPCDGGVNSAATGAFGGKAVALAAAPPAGWRNRGGQSRRACRRAAPRGPARLGTMNSALPPGASTRCASSSTAVGCSEVSSPCIITSRSTIPVASGHAVSSHRTETFSIPAGQGITPCGPGISADDPAAVGQIGAQERHGKAEARHRLPLLHAARAPRPDRGSPAAPRGPAACDNRSSADRARRGALQAWPSRVQGLGPAYRRIGSKTMPLEL